MSKHTTVRIDDGVGDVIDALVRESASTREVPALNQSEVIRLLLRAGASDLIEGELDAPGALEGDALEELIPDHKRARYLREETKDETWFVDMKRGFEGRVRDALEDRFQGGYDPEGISEFAETFVEEARIYWQIVEDDPETFAEKTRFVRQKVEEYREVHEVSTYDPDEEFLQGFSGVQDGIEAESVEEVSDEIRAVIRDRLEDRNPGREELASALALVYDLPESKLLEIVDEERRREVVEAEARAAGIETTDTPQLVNDEVAHDAHARAPDADRDDDLGADRELTAEEAAELRGDGGEAD